MRRLPSLILALLFFAPHSAGAVERLSFTPGFNFYNVAQDVQLGRENARQLDKQLPLLSDPQVLHYINDLGKRLASLAPNNNSEYLWTFKVVDSSDINAFALPGGFIYVNRGAIEAAEDEAQIAGVLAHESGHVVMRHGTHEASQALLARAPATIIEDIIGQTGSLTAQLAEIGLGLGVNSILLKNSRSAESQADEVATYILYRAGYDPHAMARFFENAARNYPQRTAQFFSDHPVPENRIKSVDSEIPLLGPAKDWRTDSAEFEATKKQLLSLPAPAAINPVLSASSGPPPAPSSHMIKFDGHGYSIGYPDNWHVQQNEDAVSLIPPRGVVEVADYGAAQVYGASISQFQPQSFPQTNKGLNDATQELLDTMRLSNPNLRVLGQTAVKLKGRSALSTSIEAASPLQGQKERDLLITTRKGDSVFSLIFIAPESSFEAYKSTFQNMLQSLDLQ
jgi:Zn-dependent protease with chaperone function